MSNSCEFLVRSIGQIQKLRSGWMVECETDRRTVAVWGSPTNQTNIQIVRATAAPFKLRSNRQRTPNDRFRNHSHWIPEAALVEIAISDALRVLGIQWQQ
jgi:hypothetical protein